MDEKRILRCDHCGGARSVHLTWVMNLDRRPMERVWSCVTCGCVWTLTWELVEKGKYCPVHGSSRGEILATRKG